MTDTPAHRAEPEELNPASTRRARLITMAIDIVRVSTADAKVVAGSSINPHHLVLPSATVGRTLRCAAIALPPSTQPFPRRNWNCSTARSSGCDHPRLRRFVRLGSPQAAGILGAYPERALKLTALQGLPADDRSQQTQRGPPDGTAREQLGQKPPPSSHGTAALMWRLSDTNLPSFRTSCRRGHTLRQKRAGRPDPLSWGHRRRSTGKRCRAGGRCVGAAGVVATACRLRTGGRRGLVMTFDHESLLGALTRLSRREAWSDSVPCAPAGRAIPARRPSTAALPAA
jgi:hypothetical protein